MAHPLTSDDIIIRPATMPQDVKAMVTLWYDASLICHDFIPADFWRSMRPDMETLYLPSADNSVAVYQNKVVGFLSLRDDFLEALFIDPAFQNKGIGAQLLAHTKQQHGSLTLDVYAQNQAAQRFYERQGFKVIEHGIDEYTGAAKITLCWQKVTK